MASKAYVSGRVHDTHKAKNNSKRKKSIHSNKIGRFEQFLLDFSTEIDLFDSNLAVPNWVFDFRDDLIRKSSANFRKICYYLKEIGLAFKIKWPVEVDGKWKFADIFFPAHKTVLLHTTLYGNFRPMGLDSYRAEFFKDRFRVVEVENVDELAKLIEEKRLK